MIQVPEAVSARAYQPSLPSDNGVNEMRWDVSRLYTALNIKVKIILLIKKNNLIKIKDSSIRQRARASWEARGAAQGAGTILSAQFKTAHEVRAQYTNGAVWHPRLYGRHVGHSVPVDVVGVLVGHYGTCYLFYHFLVSIIILINN